MMMSHSVSEVLAGFDDGMYMLSKPYPKKWRSLSSKKSKSGHLIGDPK
jgi:hypothetical protein